MSRVARICFQSLLKVVNSGIGIVGIALIVYALWMFMVWQRHLASDSAPNAPIPWYECVYTHERELLYVYMCVYGVTMIVK